jgi:hypothetical protein
MSRWFRGVLTPVAVRSHRHNITCQVYSSIKIRAYDNDVIMPPKYGDGSRAGPYYHEFNARPDQLWVDVEKDPV